MENKPVEIDLSKIEFINERVIEIDYGTFRIYNIVGTDIWLAEYYDQELYADELTLESTSDNIYFEGGQVFDTYVSKEEFLKFKELKYD